MNSISQLMKYRRSMVEYALKHGVTKTAIKYNTYRQYVYRWLRRYDGSLESLRNKSRRPKHHPKAHTAAELKLIQDLTGEAKGKASINIQPLMSSRAGVMKTIQKI